MTGGDHLPIPEVSFQPGNDEMQRCLMIDRFIFAPFMLAQLFAGRVVDHKMRITFHALDLAATEQRQRPGLRPPRKRRTSGWWSPHSPRRWPSLSGRTHGQSLRGFRQQDCGSRASASA